MFIKKAFKPAKLFTEVVGLFYDAIQTVSYLGGGTMTTAGIITLCQNMPIYIPIITLLIGIGLIGLGVYRTRIRYKAWNRLENIPELEDVLQKALEIHNHVNEISKKVINENKKKNIKTKTRVKLANKYYETLNIPITEVVKNINSDGTITNKLYKKIKQRQKFEDGNYFSTLPYLKEYARLLNKSNLGIQQAIKNSDVYKALHSDYLSLQIKLNVPDSVMNYINNLPELTYALNSLYVGINLPNPNRAWINDVPDEILVQQDEADNIVVQAYMKATMWLKNKVRLAMFREALR